MFYWYVEQSNEVTIDLDRPSVSRLYRIRWLLDQLQQDEGWLARSYLYPSESNGHCHLILEASRDLPDEDRVAIGLLLSNDPRRAARALIRSRTRGRYGPTNILITPEPYPGFYREPDAMCTCVGKHEVAMSAGRCPISRDLRRQDPLESLFPVSRPDPVYGQITGPAVLLETRLEEIPA